MKVIEARFDIGTKVFVVDKNLMISSYAVKYIRVDCDGMCYGLVGEDNVKLYDEECLFPTRKGAENEAIRQFAYKITEEKT